MFTPSVFLAARLIYFQVFLQQKQFSSYHELAKNGHSGVIFT